MIFVELPDTFDAEEQKLPFYLAMEEFLARNRTGEYFFMWQVAPTVICGRNQRVDAEVNLEYCRENGIEIYRRKSGGGCVYADRNNIMFSYIATSAAVSDTFCHFTGRVAKMLRGLGIADTAVSGRNDIVIGGRKVSGYAFYNINLPAGNGHGSPVCRAIVHGTMLYDADVATMAQAITPSRIKLGSKGVSSVRKRITTVRSHCETSIGEFKKAARNALCDTSVKLTNDDIAAIRDIERNYYDSACRFRRGGNTAVRPHRVEGVGEFVVEVALAPGVPPIIEDILLEGDFFITGDVDSVLTNPLKGCAFTREAMASALSGTDASTVIHNLSTETFVNLLLNFKD